MTTLFSRFRLPDPIAYNVNQPAVWTHKDWSILALLLLVAAALRLIFFNGFFGSDDLTYLHRSTEIAQGIWSSANYNGALRYGYNIPAAFFIYLFGLNTFTANAWTLFCSLAEVALVYFFAARYFGTRTAVLAALILASTPLHMALGTRIHADSVFALFLTLSFVLFYMAEQSGNRKLYFATGLSLGMIFWVKELGVITFLAFASYPILFRKLNKNWILVIAGGLVMLAGHLILMQILAGDPLHLIKTVTGQVQKGFIQAQLGEDGAGYYFKYLFFDIRHTWLVTFFAALTFIGLVTLNNFGNRATRFVAWWLVALLAVLSFTPVSLDPLRLVMKQSNYLNLFLAPISLLGAIFFANLPYRALSNTLIIATMLGGILLGALEQQSYRAFTANSRAAVAFMQAHPSEWMLGSVNNVNMARIVAIMDTDPNLADRFGYLSLSTETNLDKTPAIERSPFGYAVFDQETLDWGKTAIKLKTVPFCWQPLMPLEPKLDGNGQLTLNTIKSLIEHLPGPIGAGLKAKLLGYIRPRPATIYRVEFSNLWCAVAPPA